MLCLCQMACLSSSAVTVFVMQLQPSAVIIKLPPFIPPAFSRREPRAVFLLQSGFLSQNFQVLLEQPSAEAVVSSEAVAVSFSLDHPLVEAAEHWLLQQQQQQQKQRRSQTDADWQRRRGGQEPADDTEEKRQQPGQPRRQSEPLIWSQLQRGVAEEKDASWQEDPQLSPASLSGDEEKRSEGKWEKQPAASRAAPAAASREGDSRRSEQQSPIPAPLRQPAARSAQRRPAATTDGASSASRSLYYAELLDCAHDCGCDGQVGSRRRLRRTRMVHHLRDLCNHSRCTTLCAFWQLYNVGGKAEWLDEREQWRRAGRRGSRPAFPRSAGSESKIFTQLKIRSDGRTNPVRHHRPARRK